MRTCQYCGTKYKDSANRCPRCQKRPRTIASQKMPEHMQGMARTLDTAGPTANVSTSSLHEVSTLLHTPVPLPPPPHLGTLLELPMPLANPVHPLPLSGEGSQLALSSPGDPLAPRSTLTFSSPLPSTILAPVGTG